MTISHRRHALGVDRSTTTSRANEGVLEGASPSHCLVPVSCEALTDDVAFVAQFIEGMLKNLGQLPLDRIQQMLKFAPGYDRNIDQLAAFLEAARREGLVTVQNGMWKLHSA